METIYVIFTIVGIVTIPLGVIFAIKEAHDFLVVVNMFASFTTSFAVVGRMLYGDPVPRDFEKILLVLALAVVYTAIVFLIQKPFWRNPNPLWN